MEAAETWKKIQLKLIQLYPDRAERGKYYKALVDEGKEKALSYIENDDDDDNKAYLDVLIAQGMPYFANDRLHSCATAKCRFVHSLLVGEH